MLLVMDANDHVVYREMCKQLTGADLRMREVVHIEIRGPVLKTWFRGTDLINGIWVHQCKLPCLQQVTPGSYTYDGESQHELGKYITKIVPLQARWLNSKINCIRKKYIDRLDEFSP